MKPGRYLRTWAGYEVPTTVAVLGGVLIAFMPSGFFEPISNMPDAIWTPVEEA